MTRRSLDLCIGALLLAASVLAPAAVSAQATPHRSLLALSKTDHTLAIVNASDLKLIARVVLP